MLLLLVYIFPMPGLEVRYRMSKHKAISKIRQLQYSAGGSSFPYSGA